MTFKEQLATDMSVFFNSDEFADEIVYTSQVSGSKSILAIIDFGENLEDQNASVREAGKIFVKAADVANPAYRDSFVLNETTYVIQRILSGDAHTWELEFERDARPTFRGN